MEQKYGKNGKIANKTISKVAKTEIYRICTKSKKKIFQTVHKSNTAWFICLN